MKKREEFRELWEKQIKEIEGKQTEFLIKKWEPTGLLDNARDRGKLARLLENCAVYLVKYDHGEEIGANMLPAIRKIYDMDNYIKFDFQILADEFYDKFIVNPLFEKGVNYMDADCETTTYISENYAKKYVSKNRVDKIQKLFYDLDREKDWIERENLIINYIT